MEWTPGQVVFEHYTVLEVRRGGMGVVHRVHHRDWGIDLAVKTPRPEVARSADDWEAFEAEAERWVKLGLHPHTVACVYVRRLDGLPRVFAEWVDGGSLAEAIRDRRLYDGGLPRILDVAVQVAWGLEHAHSSGLVHQDVKPANVLLEPDGTAKVTDFGLARARATGTEHDTGDPLASFRGMTPAYCSPEQAEAAAGRSVRLTPGTDVWSWALCVFEMFNGEPPTPYGQAAAEVFDGFTGQPGIPAMPPAVADLLRSCFQRDPEARPNLADVAATLVEVHGDYPRTRPEATRLLANDLSNRALSLLDLGRTDEAEELWRRARYVDPHHQHTVFNHGLHLWRTARFTDEQLVSDLTAAAATRDDPLDAHLLGLVNRERGEVDGTVDFGGHTETVTALAVTRDGSVALSGDAGGRLLVWSPHTGELRHQLAKKGAEVAAVAVDGIGRTGLAGYRDGTVEVWDLRRGRSRGRRVVDAPATHVAISGDGTVGMTAHEGGSLLMWDLPTRSLVGRLTGHTQGLDALAMSSDARYAVSAALEQGDGTVRLWDLVDRRVLRTITGVGDRQLIRMLDAVAVAPDARLVVLACWEGELLVWDSRADRLASAGRNPLRPADAQRVALAADGRLLLSAGDVGVPIRFWESGSGRCLHTLGSVGVTAVAISGDSRNALIADVRCKVRVHSLPETGLRAPWSYAQPISASKVADAAQAFSQALERARRLEDDERFADAADELRSARTIAGFARHPDLLAQWSRVTRHGSRTDLLGAWLGFQLEGMWTFTNPASLALSADGTSLVTGGSDGFVRAWDATTGQHVHTFPERSGKADSIALSGDERCAVSASNDETVRVWDFASGHCRLVVGGRAFALGRERLLVGDERGVLRWYDLETGDLLRVIEGGGGRTRSLSVSPDGRVAVAIGDQDVRVVDLDTGFVTHTIPASSPVRSWISPDGDMLVLYPGGFGVTAWDLTTMRHLYSVETGGWSTVSGQATALGADWRLGVCGGLSGDARVWEIATARAVRTLDDAGHVNAIAVSDDSRFAVTGDFERKVKIWDLESGRCLRVLEAHGAPVSQIALSADGSRLVTADLAPKLCGWGLDWDYDLTRPRPSLPA